MFYSAEILSKKLNDTIQAKPLYERVIFEHPDSVFYTEAQIQYRKIRGDNSL